MSLFLSILIPIISIYSIIVLGFIGKRVFKEKIDTQSLVYVLIYFFQPLMFLWGFLKQPINFDIIVAPLIYGFVLSIGLCITFFISRKLFYDKKERSIATVAGIVGNAGSLGIPLGISLFGEESIIYTSIINFVVTIFMYTVVVYFYSRGTFSARESLKNILKLPVLYVLAVAIIINLFHIILPQQISYILEIGGYTAIGMSLFIFGSFLGGVSLKNISLKLNIFVLFVKFLLLPSLGILILSLFDFKNPLLVGVILLELTVPLAMNNINMAALFQCKEKVVTQMVFVSSILALVVIPIWLWVFEFIKL